MTTAVEKDTFPILISPDAEIYADDLSKRPYLKIVEGDTTVHLVRSYFSDDKKLRISIFKAPEQTIDIENFPADELAYLLEGEIEITDNTGKRIVFGPGDTFVLPKGFTGRWKQLSPIKKITADYDVSGFGFQPR